MNPVQLRFQWKLETSPTRNLPNMAVDTWLLHWFAIIWVIKHVRKKHVKKFQLTQSDLSVTQLLFSVTVTIILNFNSHFQWQLTDRLFQVIRAF